MTQPNLPDAVPRYCNQCCETLTEDGRYVKLCTQHADVDRLVAEMQAELKDTKQQRDELLTSYPESCASHSADATGHMWRCSKVNGQWVCASGCAVGERDKLRIRLQVIMTEADVRAQLQVAESVQLRTEQDCRSARSEQERLKGWVDNLEQRLAVAESIIHQTPTMAMMQRLAALENECKGLAAHQCTTPGSDDYGNAYCVRVRELEAALRRLLTLHRKIESGNIMAVQDTEWESALNEAHRLLRGGDGVT